MGSEAENDRRFSLEAESQQKSVVRIRTQSKDLNLELVVIQFESPEVRPRV